MTARRGFTLIELMVSASVLVILVAVALPRYAAFSERQEFAAAAQKLAACIQDAQRQAAAPDGRADGKAVRYAGAVIGTDGSCRIQVLTADATPDSLVNGGVDGSAAVLRDEGAVTLASFALGGVRAGAATLAAYACSSSVRLYFGALEKGAPVVFSCDGGTRGTLQPPTVPFGTGIALELDAVRPDTAGDARPIGGTLSVGRLGLPVLYTQNSL